MKWLNDIIKRIRDRCGFYFQTRDLLRTAATHLAKSGTERTVIAKIINHKSVDSSVTAVYERHAYEDEKRETPEKWSEKLETLIGENK